MLNHAPTAGAWQLVDIYQYIIFRIWEWQGVSRRGVIYHVPLKRKDNTMHDSSYSALQKARLFAVKISYKAFVYSATRKKFSQISQAFWLFVKTNKSLIISRLCKMAQKTLVKNTLKHPKIPPESSPFTRPKHSFDDVKGLLWACKSYALTSENTKTASLQHPKHLFISVFSLYLAYFLRPFLWHEFYKKSKF